MSGALINEDRQQEEAMGMNADQTEIQHGDGHDMYVPPTLLRMYLAEFLGTFLFIFFGIGSVTASVCTGALTGLWQVAVIWGFGATLAIYAVANISGAHLNPAVTFTHMLLRRNEFPIKKGLGYIGAQFAGAFCSGIVNLIMYNDAIQFYEFKNNIKRGEFGSEKSAMVFGCYFPNPGVFTFDIANDGSSIISHADAFFVEMFGTGVLVFMIFALTSNRNYTLASKDMAPYFIGFTIASLISVIAPLTQGGFNPARDFGPRLIAAMAGWGEIAIPGPRKGFWIYLFAPLLGGPLGGLLYEITLKPRLKTDHVNARGFSALRHMIPE